MRKSWKKERLSLSNNLRKKKKLYTFILLYKKLVVPLFSKGL